MKLIIENNQEAASQIAFERVSQVVESGAKVIGLATGSTPELLYQKLIESDLDFSQIVSVNLDEYVGLSGDHPQSYRYYMEKKLFDHKPFKESYLPNGLNDEKFEIERYNKVLEDNPVDLQILGIGENGHIAFNEPGTPLNSKTHKVQLTESTIQANQRFFEDKDQVPRYAYTMGLASIMQAKEIILLAFGENKAQAIKNLLEAETPQEEIPSTVLVDHPQVTLIIDKAAAQLLDEAILKEKS